MIKGLSYFLFIIIVFSFFLSSCVMYVKQPTAALPIDEIESATEKSKLMCWASNVPPMPVIPKQSNNLIEYQDKVIQLRQQKYHCNWKSTIKPMINNMVKIKEVNTGSILFVNNIDDQINSSLETLEATKTLFNTLINNDKFKLISLEQISIAKQRLGLSLKDVLNTLSKTIGIARNLRAQYMLYSSIVGNVHSPELKMQLIFVQTGEIIWSNKTTIKFNNISY